MKKKYLLFALLIFTAVSLTAQTKKIAILEIVDRNNSVNYAVKLMLRSSLTKAITTSEGYEAYDRTDMDAIMGEQNFQRTGLVSDEQIKRLGEMTGASYILVAEAAKVDENNMFITAKVLDVESARTIMTDNLMMGMDATKIQEGCTALAIRLFSSHSSSYYDINSNVTATSKNNFSEKIILVHHKKDEREFLNHKEFSYGSLEMDEEEMLSFLSKRCPEAYLQIMKAKKMQKAGWSVMGATCLGALFVYIPCLKLGYENYEKAIDYFNKNCQSY